MTVNLKSASERRRVSKNRHNANTLVHYLGLRQALQVCRDNMWHSVHQAIVEQHAAPAATSGLRQLKQAVSLR